MLSRLTIGRLATEIQALSLVKTFGSHELGKLYTQIPKDLQNLEANNQNIQKFIAWENENVKNIPEVTWKDSVAKYTPDTFREYAILPVSTYIKFKTGLK